MNKYFTISEVSKILNLINPKTKKPSNHILRYWEKEFKEIKPKKINNRRYYSPDQVEIIKMIKFLLKSKGMTVLGVKKILNFTANKLDVNNTHSLKADYYKSLLKSKSRTLLQKINKLKNYGKKNSS
tara:strand:- start:134 stop:514 length:381 start_codon:yes stop_codon:yes gene_type:complete